MRLLKVIFVSIILSFIVSFIASFISYVPASEREPNVYYFSMREIFMILMTYITPILLMFSMIAFFIYLLIAKIKRLPPVIQVVLSLVIAAAITSLPLYMMNKSNETNNIYLIPKGFEGDIYVFYNINGAPMVETEEGYEVHVINEKGYFVTSKPELDTGIVTDQYYYVDAKGNRTALSNKCVSLFGTAGFSTYVGDEEIDLQYTGFKLTKDHCSEEFMTQSHDQAENAEEIIHEIVKKHYGVDLRQNF